MKSSVIQSFTTVGVSRCQGDNMVLKNIFEKVHIDEPSNENKLIKTFK